MHNTKKYEGPTKAFDAVEDIKDWLGQKRWDEVRVYMSQCTNPEQFAFYCDIAGIKGYPVVAWYELYHGHGSWVTARNALGLD